MKMTVGKDDTSFHLLFQSLPIDDKLIEEYNCSFNDGPSVSIGKLYISQHHVSYAPKIGSTQIIIPIREISSISKKNTVYLFPNAIEIVTLKDQRYFFTAFLSRDLAFSTLTTIIGAGGGTRTKIFEDAMSTNEDKPIKFSNDEIPDPNEEKDPFQESPTFSTFQPRNSDLKNEQQPPQSSIQDKDKEKLLNRQTPSPSSSMFKSAANIFQNNTINPNGNNDSNAQFVENNDNSVVGEVNRERKLIDSIVDNYTETNKNNINNANAGSSSNLNSSGSEIIDEHANEKVSVLVEKKEKEIIKPIPLKENNSNNSTTTNIGAVNSTPSSPLKSSQTINSPPTTSPPQKHHTIPKQQSFTKLGVLNISSDQSILNNNNNNSNLNLSQQLPPPPQQQHHQQQHQQQHQQHQPQHQHQHQSQQQSQQPQQLPPQQPLITSSTPPESPSTSRLPKFTSFESLPQGGSCDHIIYSDFDEGPWSTEKYNISMQEFYNLIIRSDFWASVNTTHSYTEQMMSDWKPGNCCIQRTMDFRTAIAFKIGPKSTRVTQTQRCRLKNKNEFVLETSSVSKDVPYGDSFSVENLLLIQAVDENSCITKLSSKIKFSKTVWGISSMIQKNAIQGNKEFFILWNTMVRNQVETFAFNKSKAKKVQPSISTPTKTASNITIGSSKDAILLPLQPQQAQTQESVLPTKELDSIPPTSPLSSSTGTLPKDNIIGSDRSQSSLPSSSTSSPSSFNLSPNESILSAIWNKMSATEKKYLFIVLILLLSSIVGLMFMVVSTSSTSRSINQQIYRFTDTLVLLDSKITQISTGSPPIDASVTYHSDIGKDRLQYLQDRLDMANSLLQRTHSIISSLQGELSLESLKIEKADIISQGSGGFLSFSTLFITFLTMIAGFIWYSGYHTTIRGLLPF